GGAIPVFFWPSLFLDPGQRRGYSGRMASAGLTSALRAAGLRVTAPRLATLAAVAAHPHVDAETIAHDFRERLGTGSRQAVYDVLNALSDVELVRRVAVGGRKIGRAHV